MKKSILLLVVVAFAAMVNAQTSDKKWGIGLGVGAYGTLNKPKADIGLMPEFYISRYLSPKLDLTFKNEMGLWRSDLLSELDLVNTFLDLRFKLSNETKKLRPYIYGGPGFLADNGVSGLNFDLGLGAKYYFSTSTALYFEAGYIHGIESVRPSGTVHDNIAKGTIGLEFDFGKAKDADMDGVSDNKDKCPNTPAGVAVDDKGCPVDTDGDGVADYLDACPNEAGLVALKGCPDTDGDGITDKDDKCPNTKKGDKVDASGCPVVLDTDKDGVVDSEDNCPTVAGPKENKGCPVIKEAVKETVDPDMTIEPVYFDYDKSNILQVEKAKIEKLVKLLKSNDNYNVDMTGNADSKGTEEYNMKLSERRIESVIKAITSSGVKAVRVSKQKPLGESSPAATNDTEEGRALNRRVTIEVIKTK